MDGADDAEWRHGPVPVRRCRQAEIPARRDRGPETIRAILRARHQSSSGREIALASDDLAAAAEPLRPHLERVPTLAALTRRRERQQISAAVPRSTNPRRHADVIGARRVGHTSTCRRRDAVQPWRARRAHGLPPSHRTRRARNVRLRRAHARRRASWRYLRRR